MKKAIFSILILIISIQNSYAVYIYENGNLKTKIFFNVNDKSGRDALIKGKIISLSTSEELPENEMSGISQERTKATVRLYNAENVFPTNTMYVVDPNNIVVSKLNVKYTFSNQTFGDMLIGYGNFKLSNPGYRVVQIINDSGRGDSRFIKSRGDFFARSDNSGKAISEYKKSIESDPEDPGSHLALGLIYYKDAVFNFAYNELQKAYKHKDRLYDNEDRFVLMKTLAEIRFIETYDNYNLPENRVKFRKEGIGYCREALKINGKSVDVNFLLAEYYYRDIDKTGEDEEQARDRYLKVIDLQPMHSKANLRLAQYYIKNNKMKMGYFYAKKAVEGDPSNQEALELLKRIE